MWSWLLPPNAGVKGMAQLEVFICANFGVTFTLREQIDKFQHNIYFAIKGINTFSKYLKLCTPDHTKDKSTKGGMFKLITVFNSFHSIHYKISWKSNNNN